ncbi:MAG: hypothetical protein IKU32_04930 [Clostridia bacterium]|nr:hypothetical protein [Clostridia bacterium]
MRYNNTSFFGIVFALMSVTNTVLEFGYGKGIKGMSPLCLGAALLLFALNLKDAGEAKRGLVPLLYFAAALNIVAGCVQLLALVNY